MIGYTGIFALFSILQIASLINGECWLQYKAQGVNDGSVNGASDLTSCKRACIERRRSGQVCYGVDWFPYWNPGEKCWLSVKDIAKTHRPQAGAVHYDYRPNCQPGDCWIQYNAQGVNDGLRNGASDVAECKRACIERSAAGQGCYGVDWFPTWDPGTKCWLSVQDIAKTHRPQSGAVHYDYICQPDADECRSRDEPCNSATEHCVNTAGSFRCDCRTGFQKSAYGACSDIDECISSTAYCDLESQTCSNTFGSYICICNSGYVTTSGKCEDVNECESSGSSCSSKTEICVNAPGSYRCECKTGFEKSPSGECEDISECDRNDTLCGLEEVCQNTNGSYKCITRVSPVEGAMGVYLGLAGGLVCIIVIVSIVVVLCRRQKRHPQRIIKSEGGTRDNQNPDNDYTSLKKPLHEKEPTYEVIQLPKSEYTNCDQHEKKGKGILSNSLIS